MALHEVIPVNAFSRTLSILALLSAFLALPVATASAQAWFEIDRTDGSTGTSQKDKASKGKIYGTTLDGSGTSAGFDINECAEVIITMPVIASGVLVQACESLACTLPVPFTPTGTPVTVGQYVLRDAGLNIFRITNGTVNDRIFVHCGRGN